MTYMVDDDPVYAYNAATRTVILMDDSVVKLSKLFDTDGEETQDTALAVSAVGELSDGKWLAVNLRAFNFVPH